MNQPMTRAFRILIVIMLLLVSFVKADDYYPFNFDGGTSSITPLCILAVVLPVQRLNLCNTWYYLKNIGQAMVCCVVADAFRQMNGQLWLLLSAIFFLLSFSGASKALTKMNTMPNDGFFSTSICFFSFLASYCFVKVSYTV